MGKAPTAESNPAPEYLTPKGLVRRYDGAVTTETLRNWRSRGRGPPWRKLETRVVYRIADVIEWEKSNDLRDRGAKA